MDTKLVDHNYIFMYMYIYIYIYIYMYMVYSVYSVISRRKGRQ
jgi:hypothetical protein